MLVQNFYVKDIKKYENDNGKSVFDMFARLSFSDLITLIVLGNTNCSEEQAGEMLDAYLVEHTMVDAYNEVKFIMFGSVDDKDVPEENKIDVRSYKKLGDLFHFFCMNLMSVGLTYTEFWTLDTRDVYKLFEDISIKLEPEMNKLLSLAHATASMTGSAVWGKLEKEAPKVNYGEDINNSDKLVWDEEYGEIEIGMLNAIRNQKALRENLNAITKE